MSQFIPKLLCVLFLGLPLVSHASELRLLIDMLHENDMISEQQYDRLLAELEQNQQHAAKEKQQIVEKLELATQPSEVEVSAKGGLRISSTDGEFETRIRGRLMIDAADYDGAPQIADGTNIRRARFAWSGRIYRDWLFKLDYDFSDGGELKDSYIGYSGFSQARLRMGLMEIPLGLQYRSSSANSQLIERSLLGAFGGDRYIGVMADTKRQHWSAAAGVFGDDANEQRERNDEGWGVGARVTMAPFNHNNNVLHFGLASFYRHLNDQATLRFDEQPEARVAGFDIVDTGIIPGARTYTRTGLEWAVVHNRWSAQAEYMLSDVSRETGQDITFSGGHFQSGFFLTADSLNYENGDFGSPQPNHPLGEGGIGAWELVARYSSLDLTDKDVTGGEIDSLTFGLNWYPVPMLRFSANYINVLNVDGGPNAGQEPRIFLVRSQWAF